jgi:hypothetical protein
MKLVIDIPDNEATFAMKVLRSLSFVKKVKKMSVSSLELFEDLKEAANEVRLHKEGKIKLQTLDEFLNEV